MTVGGATLCLTRMGSVLLDRVAARLVFCVVISGAVPCAFAAQANPVQLSSMDRESIAAAACTVPGARAAERIDATTAKRGSTSIDATVQCQPHRSIGKSPVARHSTCHNRPGTWVCGKGHEAAQVIVHEKASVMVVPSGIELAAAVDVVERSSKMTYPPFTELAWPLFKGTCTVGQLPTAGREGLTRFSIECTGGKLEMHRLCWKEGCRHFNVSGDRARP
jgi:hypothetical protein